MTNPNEDLLATTEGVDEGSADSTAEEHGTRSTEELTGRTNPVSQALGDPPTTDQRVEAEPAAPVDTESAESRAAKEQAGPGQQLETGEG